MTYLEKAKEIRPDIQLTVLGFPRICPWALEQLEAPAYCPREQTGADCVECWNREFKGDKTDGCD